MKNSKLKAAKAPFVPASKIVRETIQEQIRPSQCEALLPMENMIRNVNNYRKNLRPTDPSSKNFELLIESISQDFLLEDIINGESHIIFATKKTIKSISICKDLVC